MARSWLCNKCTSGGEIFSYRRAILRIWGRGVKFDWSCLWYVHKDFVNQLRDWLLVLRIIFSVFVACCRVLAVFPVAEILNRCRGLTNSRVVKALSVMMILYFKSSILLLLWRSGTKAILSYLYRRRFQVLRSCHCFGVLAQRQSVLLQAGTPVRKLRRNLFAKYVVTIAISLSINLQWHSWHFIYVRSFVDENGIETNDLI